MEQKRLDEIEQLTRKRDFLSHIGAADERENLCRELADAVPELILEVQSLQRQLASCRSALGRTEHKKA